MLWAGHFTVEKLTCQWWKNYVMETLFLTQYITCWLIYKLIPKVYLCNNMHNKIGIILCGAWICSVNLMVICMLEYLFCINWNFGLTLALEGGTKIQTKGLQQWDDRVHTNPQLMAVNLPELWDVILFTILCFFNNLMVANQTVDYNSLLFLAH